MTRTDVHSPANLITEDYEYFWCFDNNPEPPAPGPFVNISNEFLQEIVTGIQKSPVSERSYHQCHHCGARIRYVALLKHLPTGAIIAVGETCLDNRFELATAEFHKLRKQAQLDREAHRIKTAAEEQLSELDPDLVDCLAKKDPETYVNEFTQAARAHHIVSDIRRKLWLYGSISVGQVNLVGKLIIQEQEAQARKAEREAEVKVDAPEGRFEIVGTVVSRKWKDSDFGGNYKIVVKVEEEDGIWLAYVTEPSRIETERGDVVKLTATWTRSDTDPSFAFGKRPSKPSIVKEAAAA